MSSSDSPYYSLRQWWALTSTAGRVFVIGLLVVVALLVWALLPSEEEKQVEECAKRIAASSYNDKESREKTLQGSKQLCQSQWKLSH
ncbi:MULTISPECIES: hypothetical protein [Mycolicibacterium]|uniref:hypothetical protein n=1 Tax=Mycolicibacterium TaxID=1866885 RepID=UPI00262A736C|nr:hypothetical protein [Mycolicibacterium fortuitum]